jgi:competence protein ComFB
MELHNTIKSKVISKVEEIFEALNTAENAGKFCTCDQCKMDVICYVLNRTPPRYIVSNRGVSRSFGEGIGWQQQAADIVALIHDGLKQINHNLRPNFNHFNEKGSAPDEAAIPKFDSPASIGKGEPEISRFNIPTIMGRVFNGNSFAPISNASVELLWAGELVTMKDGNWQNPYNIVPIIEGNFSFWPAPVPASKANNHKIFEYTLRVSAPEFETLTHIFKIPVASNVEESGSFSPDRTFKLPDLYMFPPGEAEKNGYLD